MICILIDIPVLIILLLFTLEVNVYYDFLGFYMQNVLAILVAASLACYIMLLAIVIFFCKRSRKGKQGSVAKKEVKKQTGKLVSLRTAKI